MSMPADSQEASTNRNGERIHEQMPVSTYGDLLLLIETGSAIG